eukprot:TRINITY_DN10849_c0_g1_i2.p1 TRINITY_DN10849_c0_g1~~TRINITY_DN10849_c0_g1_i2.p1  ORF type:complete len:110 (-),score=6.40 TRINITY_DN10849_c0_g1_i2:278-607(-)
MTFGNGVRGEVILKRKWFVFLCWIEVRYSGQKKKDMTLHMRILKCNKLKWGRFIKTSNAEHVFSDSILLLPLFARCKVAGTIKGKKHIQPLHLFKTKNKNRQDQGHAPT